MTGPARACRRRYPRPTAPARAPAAGTDGQSVHTSAAQYLQTQRLADRQTGQTDRLTNRQKDRQEDKGRQTDRKTDKQTNSRLSLLTTDRETNRQTDKADRRQLAARVQRCKRTRTYLEGVTITTPRYRFANDESLCNFPHCE